MKRNCGNCRSWLERIDYCCYHDCGASENNCCDNHMTVEEELLEEKELLEDSEENIKREFFA